MSSDEKIIKNKVGLLKLAKLLGSVSEACKVMVSWRSQTLRTPPGETNRPHLVSSLATRTWPNAGFSKAISITAFSTCSSTRFLGQGLRRLISRNASSPPLSYNSLKR